MPAVFKISHNPTAQPIPSSIRVGLLRLLHISDMHKRQFKLFLWEADIDLKLYHDILQYLCSVPVSVCSSVYLLLYTEPLENTFLISKELLLLFL